MHWPLRRKLFVTVGGGAAVLALVMSLLVDLTVVDKVHKHEDRGLARTQAAFEALQDYRRGQLLERCRLVSELPHFKAAVAVYDPTVPAAEQTEALATVSDVARRILVRMDVDLLTLTGIDGRPLLVVGPAIEYAVNDVTPIGKIAKRAMQQVSSDGVLELGGGLVHVAAVQIEVGGLQLGSLCLGTRLDAGLANSLEEMTGSAVAMVGENGVAAQSDGVPVRAGIVLRKAWQDVSRNRASGETRIMVKIEGDRYRTLWTPLLGPEGRPLGAFVVLRSEDQALAFLANVRQGLAGIVAAAVLVALFFSFLFARQLTIPIGKLVAFTRRVSQGDMNGRLHLGTRDELAQLGEAFNQMTQGLAESRRHLEQSNRSLEERSNELERSNKDLHRSKEKTEEVNAELQAAHAQLIQAGKMAAFGELGAGIAHELRQPLSSIRGFAQLVLMKLSPGERDSRRHLELVIQSVDHMTQIVQGLKDFARQSSFEFNDVDVNDVLERTCLLLSAQLRAHDIEIRQDLDASAPCVRGDANQLQQVCTNLLANARDAMEDEGGVIRIGSRTLGDGSYVMVSVSDEGPGVPPDILPKIFGSFFTTKPEGKGTGLGLSISQGIIQDHGGRIDVSSRTDEGTTFRIFLPTRRAKNCWEMIDCVSDCRPEISGKEECAVYRERRGHRCWESLREMARHDPRVSQPNCERCPVHMAKTTFIAPPDHDSETRTAA
jgi:signal transduction histidine kinase